MQVRHIYCFTFFSPISASTRYRAQFVLQKLKKDHNVTFTLVCPGYSLKNIVHFIRTYMAALLFRRKHSLIMLQKIHTDNRYARALKLLVRIRKKNTVYDTDDADYLRYPTKTMHFFMSACSHCIVGSEHLVRYTRKLNSSVTLLSSPVIEHLHYKKQRNANFTIGWVGEYDSTSQMTEFSHVLSLNKLVFPAIKRLDFPCTLLLMGVTNKESAASIREYFVSNRNISIVTPLEIDWLNEDHTYKQISTLDVGLAPLVDHEFNQAKSAFKLKQYLSCGVPVLASPIGENNKFLDHGKSGYLCNTSEEFYQNLLKIKEKSDEDYMAMSRYAREQLPAFSVEKYAKDFLKYYSIK